MGGDATFASHSLYVVNISGGATPGTVTITSPTLSASQATTLKTTVGALSVDSAAALNLATSTATSVSEGNSTNTTSIAQTVKSNGTITNVVGSTTVNSQGSVSGDFSGYGTSFGSNGHIRCTSTDDCVDSPGNLVIGGTSAGNVQIGNSANTLVNEIIGNPVEFFVGSTQVGKLALSSTDYIAGGGATVSATGFIRVPAGSSSFNIISAYNAALPNIAFDSAGALQLSGYTGGAGVKLYDAATLVAQWYNSSSTVELLLPTGETGGFAMGQTAPSSVVAVGNWVFNTTAPNGGSGTAAQNTPASFLVNVPVPGAVGTAGNEAYLGFERNGSLYFAASRCTPAGGSAASCLWAGPGIATQTTSATNFVLATDGSTYAAYNSPGSGSTLYFENNDGEVAQINSSGFTPGAGVGLPLGTTTQYWGGAVFGGTTTASNGMFFQFTAPILNSGLSANAATINKRSNVTASSGSTSGVTLATITLPSSGTQTSTFCINWTAQDITALTTANGGYTCATFFDHANSCSQIGSTTNLYTASTSVISISMTLSGCTLTIKQAQASGTDVWRLMGELQEIDNQQ